MTLRKPEEVSGTLRNTFQAVLEASIDAKLTKLQQIRMDGSEPVMKYSNLIHSLLNELIAADHTIQKLEKKRALLRGLRAAF